MSKIRFGLIGSGWRAEFYIRIAKALPEMFDLAAVMIRSKEKGEAFSAKFSVKVVNTLDELVEKEPEFVVMAIKRGIVTENLITFHLPDQCRDGTHTVIPRLMSVTVVVLLKVINIQNLKRQRFMFRKALFHDLF